MKNKQLIDTLRSIKQARNNLEQLMSTLTIADVDNIFDNNPVFYDGDKLSPEDVPEQYHTNRYIYLLSMLSKTHAQLIKGQELMLTLGIQYVRLEARTEVSHRVEEDD